MARVPPVELPELVRQRAAAHGAIGARWVADLPEVLADLAARWDLALGPAYEGGTAGYVVRATDGAGRACVLKVAMRMGEDDAAAFGRSVIAHRLAAGQGCAELLAHDEDAGAMLLERLGPNLDALGTPVPALLDAVADTLRIFWRPVAPDCGLPTGKDQAAWLARFITTTWDALGRPCPQAVVDRALDLCGRRSDAFDPDAAVLVHGDAHGWNTLDAGAGRWKFVDPEGLRSERAHDLAVPMREYNEPLLAGDTARLVRERAERLAGRCGADAQAVWEWGFIERVSTGLAGLRDFEGGDDSFLVVAERCL